MTREIITIDTQLWRCVAPDTDTLASHVVTSAQAAGASFLRSDNKEYPDDLRIHITSQGNLHTILCHPALYHAAGWWKARAGCGCASLNVFSDGNAVYIGQDVYDNPDALAHGQLTLARLLYPLLRPSYGFVNEPGKGGPLYKDMSNTELTRLAWANFLGPEYVRKYGREFLLNAPCWQVSELSEGGVLCVVTERYTQWISQKPQDVWEYFRAQIPAIKLYRSKVGRDW
jgi:hypothetical protein